MKTIGRLTGKMEKEIEVEAEQSISKIIAGNQNGKKKLTELAKNENYFVRKNVGKIMAQANNESITKIAEEFLQSNIYALRATAVYYFYYLYDKAPEKFFPILEEKYDTVRWEVEDIVNKLWETNPQFMKKSMRVWMKSDNPEKRAFSFHGMESLAPEEPQYVMELINELIDDESIIVQKKITHILTQVARYRPADVYPHLKEWLKSADEKKIKTIWVSMKKLATLINQQGQFGRLTKRKNNSREFVQLTKETIYDWKNDSNPNVAKIGEKLYHIISNRRRYR